MSKPCTIRANIGARLVLSVCLLAAGLLGSAAPVRAQAPGERSAVTGLDCDHGCLVGFLHSYLDALTHKEPARAAFAKGVRFTENDIELPLGREGVWATVSAVAPTGLEVADVATGNAAWMGVIYEHELPAFLALRLKVQGQQITEVETVVQRKGGLPAPFGDPQKLVHDPAFAEVLPAPQRRERERLVAVANGYFATVEQNDGQIFTAFDPDCQRTENGISTTAGAAGAAAIAQGCESQFKLGLYRINKRVRERRYPLVDEERGVVVAMGFFDHANTFDTYKTTDGQERKTALKWPNSLTLMEAFKIRNGQIYRVEAVFSYAPYFMHSPWSPVPQGAQSPTQPVSQQISQFISKLLSPSSSPNSPNSSNSSSSPSSSSSSSSPKSLVICDRACLEAAASGYMEALVSHDPAKVQWAPVVRYTENSVPMQIGDGVWGAVSGKGANPVLAADPVTHNAAWYGIVEEHGQPAYYAMRLKVVEGKVAEVEAVIRRKGYSGPFADPAKDSHDPAFAEAVPDKEQLTRAALIKLADGYFSTLANNDGTLHTSFDRECERQENGVATTQGSTATGAQGCEAQFKMGWFHFSEAVRARRYFIADPERGVVVAAGYIDHPARMTSFKLTDGTTRQSPVLTPNSLGLMEMFKIKNGHIYRIEAVFSDLPYGMSAPWQ